MGNILVLDEVQLPLKDQGLAPELEKLHVAAMNFVTLFSPLSATSALMQIDTILHFLKSHSGCDSVYDGINNSFCAVVS